MAFNIGVNVVEVDGRASSAIVAPPLSVAGLLVLSQRGVPNLPVLARSYSDFTANFGGPIASAYGAHAVRGFFENGGRETYVVRITDDNASAAKVDLMDRASVAVKTFGVEAGRRGQSDPGEWGNALAVTIVDHGRASQFIPGQVIGAKAEPFALTAGQGLTVRVNGGATPIDLVLNAADFSNLGAAAASEVAAAINRRSAAVRAAVTPDHKLVLASATPGASSRLEITDLAATTGGAAILGFTGGSADTANGLVAGTTLVVLPGTGGLLAGTAARLEIRGFILAVQDLASAIPDNSGIDVTVNGAGPAVAIRFANSDFINPGAVTPGEVVAVVNRQARGFRAELTAANRLMLLSTRYGAGSSLALAVPAGGVADATAALGLTGPTLVPGKALFHEVASVSESGRFITLTTGLASAIPTSAARLESVEFDLVTTRDEVEVERFESLSMQPGLPYSAVASVNHPESGSRHIKLTNANSASGVGLNTPAAGTFALGATSGKAGKNGDPPLDIHYIGDPAKRTGLFAFDRVDIQLLACPETSLPGVVAACLNYCEARGELMYVGTTPQGYDLEGIKTYAAPFRGRKVFGALYGPRIQVVNPLDTTGNIPLVFIPPDGHVLGVYARIAEQRGIWKAPAGDEAVLRNALGVEFDMTDADHTDLVKNGGVNGIRAIPGAGIVVDASRTLSTDSRWLFVNVRRLFNHVKAALRRGLTWVGQEPHTEELRRKVKFNVVTPFLLGLWRQGAFGSDPPAQAFTVKCDVENNPPEEVDLGNFKLEVYFYPTKPVETIVVVVGQQPSGATSARES